MDEHVATFVEACDADLGRAADDTYARRVGENIFSKMLKPSGSRQTPSRVRRDLEAEARKFEYGKGWRSRNAALASWFAAEIREAYRQIPEGVAGKRKRQGMKAARYHVQSAVEAFNKVAKQRGRDDLINYLLWSGEKGAPRKQGETSPGKRVLLKLIMTSFGHLNFSEADIKRAIKAEARARGWPQKIELM